MKAFGNFLLGLLAVLGIVLLVCLSIVFVSLIFYGIGWTTGWFLHLLIGPDIVFGMTFEEFFGVFFLIIGLVGVGRTAVNQEEVKKKVDEGIKEGLKNYRGY